MPSLLQGEANAERCIDRADHAALQMAKLRSAKMQILTLLKHTRCDMIKLMDNGRRPSGRPMEGEQKSVLSNRYGKKGNPSDSRSVLFR
jgi:hypothetical protein